jgi:hypothetical protein
VFTHAVIIAAVASATISSPVNPIEVMLPRQHHFFFIFCPDALLPVITDETKRPSGVVHYMMCFLFFLPQKHDPDRHRGSEEHKIIAGKEIPDTKKSLMANQLFNFSGV